MLRYQEEYRLRRQSAAVTLTLRLEDVGQASVQGKPISNPPGEYAGNDKTAYASREEGGDDVKSSWPLRPGQHTCYNGRYRVLRASNSKPITKSRSQFGLRSATRPHEAGIASNRISAMIR
eukprot:gene15123-20353_t